MPGAENQSSQSLCRVCNGGYLCGSGCTSRPLDWPTPSSRTTSQPWAVDHQTTKRSGVPLCCFHCSPSLVGSLWRRSQRRRPVVKLLALLACSAVTVAWLVGFQKGALPPEWCDGSWLRLQWLTRFRDWVGEMGCGRGRPATNNALLR